MDTLKVIYSQYSLQEDLESKFGKHLNTIKKNYCAPREVGPTKFWDVPFLDATTLDLQRFTFVLSMKNNSRTTMEPPHDFNPLIWLWKGLTTRQVAIHCITKYIKLAEIVIVQVIGSMEDEHTINTISYMISKLKNRLTSHLDLVIFGDLYVFPTLLHPWGFCIWCCHPRMEGDVCMVWWWHTIIGFLIFWSFDRFFYCDYFLQFHVVLVFHSWCLFELVITKS